jgi:hypothetical protein
VWITSQKQGRKTYIVRHTVADKPARQITATISLTSYTLLLGSVRQPANGGQECAGHLHQKYIRRYSDATTRVD